LNSVAYLIAELLLGTEVIGYGHEEFLGDVVFKLVIEKEKASLEEN